MIAPATALRAAIRADLAADPDVLASMGGTLRLFDEPPRGIRDRYAVFVGHQIRDWSTGSDRGEEHLVTIAAWAPEGAAKPALEIAARLRARLNGARLDLAPHRLVLMTVQATDTARDRATGLVRAETRLRALVEPAA